ncbi:MAG: DNA-binding response regulator, partial [Ardenticatenales bacterium]|nr:DNA-binding response regulator [Ardenticatenales bacterium]
MNPIKVFIADDHPMVRTGIRFTIADEPDLLLMGEAEDGEML